MGVSTTPSDDIADGTESAYGNGKKSELSYADFVKSANEQLVYAITLGMTPEQFWEGDVTLFWAYVRAAKIKRKQEDQLAWVQGYYINLAFADVLNAAFSGKGKKPKKIYPEKPLFAEQEEKRRKQAEKRKQTAQERIAATIFEKLSILNERTNKPLIDEGRID